MDVLVYSALLCSCANLFVDYIIMSSMNTDCFHLNIRLQKQETVAMTHDVDKRCSDVLKLNLPNQIFPSVVF